MASWSPQAMLSLKRKVGQYIIPVALSYDTDLGDTDLEDCPFICSDAQVRCLSQTRREITDPAVGDRDACVVEGSERGWERVLVTEDKYPLTSARTVICCESYKVLEADLTEIMAATGGMKSYVETVSNFKEVIFELAEFSQCHVQKVDCINWPSMIPFGVLALALQYVIESEAETLEDVKIKELMICQGKHFFFAVLDEAILCLETMTAAEAVVLDVTMIASLAYMKNQKHFTDIVREFAMVASLRQSRNLYSHPFVASSPEANRQSALEFYRRTLKNPFTQGFRNVSTLALIRLEAEQVRIPKKVQTLKQRVHAAMRSVTLNEV